MTPDQKEQYRELIEKYSADLKIDSRLVEAIIEVESSGSAYAVRYEPYLTLSNNPTYFARLNHITEDTERVLQKCSWGVGQILGVTSRDLGFVGSLNSLCEPARGIYWMCVLIKKISAKYLVLEDRIAAYNSGTPMHKDDKTYINQDYVEKVLKILKQPKVV